MEQSTELDGFQRGLGIDIQFDDAHVDMIQVCKDIQILSQ